jgi:putative alpha-1,2-mannosidase
MALLKHDRLDTKTACPAPSYQTGWAGVGNARKKAASKIHRLLFAPNFPRGWHVRSEIRAAALLAVIAVPGVGITTHSAVGMLATTKTDYTRYVNVDQGPNRMVVMHYPLGRVALWSQTSGETPDLVTRGIRLYPTVDQVVYKDSSDWRASVAATPALTKLTYGATTPAKGSTAALTVTRDVSVFRYHFNNVASYESVVMAIQELSRLGGYGGITWSKSTWKYVDSHTAQVVLSDGTPQHTHYFYIRFSKPARGFGTITGAGVVTRGARIITGDPIGGYVTFPRGTDVTVAVALSMTSMSKARSNFAREFGKFGFARAVNNLRTAWNNKLGRIRVEGTPLLATRMVYTALYTVYANIFDVTDNPTGYVPVPRRARLLTIGSAPEWEYEGGGYLRCSFDQGRDIYSLITLIDPKLMTVILNTYLAQANHDGYLFGNWDPFSVASWSDQQWGFFSNYFLRAKLQGVKGVDYSAAERAILKTQGKGASKRWINQVKFYRYGYVPADLSSNYLSRGMELSIQLSGLARLAYLNGDRTTYHAYFPWSTAYLKTWNARSMIFQGKNSNGTWAPAGGGLFEGNPTTYAFDEPHDGLGLARIYGESTMVADLDSTYGSAGANPDGDWNDYQVYQPYLAYFANGASTAQKIIATQYVPAFKGLNMWESGGGGAMFYTDNAGSVLLGLLGIFPLQSPGAEWVLNSPTVRTAVIRGATDLTIRSDNTSSIPSSTPYVSSLLLNGVDYPSHFISGETLVKHANTLTFGMARTPSRIGSMYVTGTDGEVLSAKTDEKTYLQFQNDPVGTATRVKIYTRKRPKYVYVNGRLRSSAKIAYNSARSDAVISGLPAGKILIKFVP